MSVVLIAVIAFAVFLILLLVEVPIGLALAVSGTVGGVLVGGSDVMASVVASVPFASTSRYTLIVIPMFVLLGALVAHAGIGERIFYAANKLVGRLPGGLPATTVIATTIFSGISGSSAADIATIGRVSVGEMRRTGYPPEYAAAVVAAAGTFAVLVPPSVALVLYGIIAGESVGAMLLAGVVPGVISGFILVAAVVGRALTGKSAASPSSTSLPAHEPKIEPQPPRRAYSGLVYAAVLFLVVAGGLYAGVFTATESAAVGAFVALLMTVVARRRGDTGLGKLLNLAIRETANVTSMIFLLLVGGAIFTYFVASSRIPSRIAEWVTGLGLAPTMVVVVILLIMIPLGMFLDGLSVMLLVIPIVAPIVSDLGFDGVWFGVLVIKMIEIGLITPPVGINVYIISGIVDDCPPERVFRSVTPFVVLDLAVTALFFAFPSLITWLPGISSA